MTPVRVVDHRQDLFKLGALLLHDLWRPFESKFAFVVPQAHRQSFGQGDHSGVLQRSGPDIEKVGGEALSLVLYFHGMCGFSLSQFGLRQAARPIP